jgi:hypothetical protein
MKAMAKKTVKSNPKTTKTQWSGATARPRSKKEVGGGWSWRPELPVWIFLVLALLSAPRIIAHDSNVVDLDSLPYTILVVAPLLVYAAIALALRCWRPFYNFMVLGIFLGLVLAATHQLMWDIAWANDPPTIGGNLMNTFDPAVEELFLRSFAVVSSIITGLVMGALFGLIAAVAQRVRLATGSM